MSKKIKLALGILLVLLVVAIASIFFLKKNDSFGDFFKKINMENSKESNSLNNDILEDGKISESKMEKRIEEIKAKVEAESDPEKKKAISEEEGKKILMEAGLIR